MDFENTWNITKKDFSVFKKKRGIIFTWFLFPISFALGFPAILMFIVMRHHISYSNLIPLFNAFSFFFIIFASAIPIGVASYSMIGEKVEKTLEPLLATPVTDGEILLGKSIAAFIPSILSTYLGAGLFMIIINMISHQDIGYYFYPNWAAGVFLLLAAPLACLLSIELNIITSVRVNDVRTSQQFGGLIIAPFMLIYVFGEIGVISLDAKTLFIVSAVLIFVDILLFFLSKSTFRREEILTNLN